jgi:hypothetical protein
MKSKTMVKVGAYAFMIGVVIALIAGIIVGLTQLSAQSASIITALLVVLGLIVGFLNVSEAETSKFLMASVAVMIALFTAGNAIQSQIATLGILGKMMWAIMGYINIFVFPATIVVAIRAIFSVAHD